MLPPSTVRVGPVRYRILFDADEIKRVSDEADLEADSEWTAFSDHRVNIIGIDPKSHPDQQRASLVHELLHCCLRFSGAWPNTYAKLTAKAGKDYDIPVEEFTVGATAYPLLSVLRDNPELLAWLTASDDE
jgi:hypothetical protein